MSSFLALGRLCVNSSLSRATSWRQFHHHRIVVRKVFVSRSRTAAVLIGAGALVAGCATHLNAHYDLKWPSLQSILTTLLSRFEVQCEQASARKNRTAHYEETVVGSEILKSKEDSFDWAEFLRLVFKEKWYFIAATIVNLIRFDNLRAIQMKN